MEWAARRYQVPLLGLVALGRAESNWTRTAERWGVPPDQSFGYGQITVALARSYGIGDGTPDSALTVRAALLDRERSIDLMARHYASCLARVPDGDLLNGMVVYNAGWLPPVGHEWWTRWADNVQRYREALEWAHTLLDF